MTDKLSEEDGIKLLRAARERILREFGREKEDLSKIKDSISSSILQESRGAFVSLHKKGELRGCIGNIEPTKPIWESVMENATHAAFNDSRFSPLSYTELQETAIEVSILSTTQKIGYTDAKDLQTRLRPGIDGVLIRKKYHSATFLPQVWEQLKDADTFLTHLCTKAGLPSQEWKSGNLDVFVYQVQSFEE